MYLGLMFIAILPIAVTVEDAVWAFALYGFGLFWALVIALLAHRWYRVTVIESGTDYRVLRFQSLRGARKPPRL
jgi:branched-subunit amino acid transport protein AzlD